GDIRKAKQIAVNGIRTYPGSNDGDGLDKLRGDVAAAMGIGKDEVLGVYNATEGTDIWGSLQDAGQGIADKIQAHSADRFQALFGRTSFGGIRIGPENPAVASLVDAIRQSDANTVVAYSQGGPITAVALWQLYNQGYDLSYLNVITIGSAEFDFPPGPHYEHHVHLNDLIGPMILGTEGLLQYFFYNPVTLTKQLITGEVKFDSSFYLSIDPSVIHSSEGYFRDF
ncbi:MAG: hypothetical protein K8I82_13710, partial [Anaerolineae bacterium]|nr:hypothetical protein [Anaerolineae bacterium]